MTAAPHLPPKSCNLRAHRTWLTLPMLLLVIVVATLASLTMAVVTVVWIAPPVATDSSFQSALRAGSILSDTASLNSAEPFVTSRVWQVYETSAETQPGFYPQSYTPQSLMLISSDGWAVMVGSLEAQDIDEIEVIDQHGRSHAVQETLYDEISGLTYVHIDAVTDAPFFRFANWNALSPESDVWLLARDMLSEHVLGNPDVVTDAQQYAVWQQTIAYQFDHVDAVVAVTPSGELVGLVAGNGKLIPSWYVDNQYRAIVGEKRTRYMGASWQGYMVRGQGLTDAGGSRSIEGFYVAIPGPSDPLRAGDIVTNINGEPVTRERIVNQLLYANDPMTITVLRADQLLDLSVAKRVIVP